MSMIRNSYRTIFAALAVGVLVSATALTGCVDAEDETNPPADGVGVEPSEAEAEGEVASSQDALCSVQTLSVWTGACGQWNFKVKNTCSTSRRIKFIIDHGPDIACTTIAGGQTRTLTSSCFAGGYTGPAVC